MSELKEFYKRAYKSDDERSLELYNIIDFAERTGIGVAVDLNYQKFIELMNKLRKVMYV